MKALTFVLCLFVVACSETVNFAPVSEISMLEPVPKTGFHRVMQGETLYSVAWRYGLDYRYLAERNRIPPPYTILAGTKIYLQGGDATVISLTEPDQFRKANLVKPPMLAKKTETLYKPLAKNAKVIWLWPARGKVITAFSSMHKGINIAGKKGQPIYAAAAGRVVYAGNGLRGYGNLIIIKHNSLYLSAYAHNNKVYVKEGDSVNQGQKIAEMGNTGTDKTMLHFEVRNAGKPVDPISLLAI